ncbi:DUF2884 family protein [Echinimonas agarilytica]|uniref:YggN family protein n=1 Tax=Echinimonas agarilytica TaxID=1215918 RepID=A0AA41W7N3_9GAMM|nr:DUF2884 family protein [Echinimonas agarilytica]MCM2680068.1 YggN family protein [Echinimonas agarilytica]
MRQTLITALTLFVSTSSLAFECVVNLDMDVAMTPQQIELRNDESVHVIIQPSQLIIDEREIDLNAASTQLLSKYDQQLRQLVPTAIGIAEDGLEIGLSAADTVMQGFGSSAQQQDEFNALTRTLRDNLTQQFSHDGNRYYLGAISEGELGEELSTSIENVVEKALMIGLSSTFHQIGDLFDSDKGDFDQQMSDFGQRMEAMADQIDQQVSPQKEQLIQRAESLCHQALELKTTQDLLIKEVPQLSSYQLISL